jgi:hypothetical protein
MRSSAKEITRPLAGTCLIASLQYCHAHSALFPEVFHKNEIPGLHSHPISVISFRETFSVWKNVSSKG